MATSAKTATTDQHHTLLVEAFHPLELKAAIGVTPDGLLIFPPKPIKADTTPITYHNNRPHLTCAVCNKALLFGRFTHKDRAMNRHPRCIQCRKTKRPKPAFVPRRMCMSNTGALCMLCRVCGKYKPTSKIQRSRIWTMRSICPTCQSNKTKTKNKHKFITSRKHAFVFTYMQRCSICMCHSTTRICTYCRDGQRNIPVASSIPNFPAGMANIHVGAIADAIIAGFKKTGHRTTTTTSTKQTASITTSTTDISSSSASSLTQSSIRA